MTPSEKLFTSVAATEGDSVIHQDIVTLLVEVSDIPAPIIKKAIRAARKAAAAKNSGTKSEEEIEELIKDIFLLPPDDYWVYNHARREYERRRTRDIENLLKQRGLNPKVDSATGLSEVQETILKIQEDQTVSYAGPICALPVGLRVEGALRVLVTRQPDFKKPRQDDPTPFLRLVEDITGRHVLPEADGENPGEDQYHTIMGWLRQALRSHQNPDATMPGQTLVLAGDPGIGKNRFTYFVGKLLGDRICEPARLATNFNSQILESTLIVAHDSALPDDAGAVRDLWLWLKSISSNREHRIEAKYQNSRTLPIVGLRAIVTTNLGAEAGKALPPVVLEHGSTDKTILLRACAPQTPYPAQGSPAGDLWTREVLESLRAVTHHLLFEYTLPEHLQDIRFGVRAYHHQELVSAINGAHPDRALGEYIDAYLAAPGWSQGPWTGNATALLTTLRDFHGPVAFAAVTKSAAHLGRQLKRLAALPGWSSRLSETVHWIGAGHHQEERRWSILPLGTTPTPTPAG